MMIPGFLGPLLFFNTRPWRCANRCGRSVRPRGKKCLLKEKILTHTQTRPVQNPLLHGKHLLFKLTPTDASVSTYFLYKKNGKPTHTHRNPTARKEWCASCLTLTGSAPCQSRRLWRFRWRFCSAHLTSFSLSFAPAYLPFQGYSIYKIRLFRIWEQVYSHHRAHFKI